MSVKLIVAVDENFGIGYKNQLLFRLKEDMIRFRILTTSNQLSEQSNIVVMGSRTFESLKTPLVNRLNVVVSRNPNYHVDEHLLNKYDILIEHDLEKILNLYKTSGTQSRDLYIIGGSEVYSQSFQYVDEIYLTKIHSSAELVDAYFPEVELEAFEIESSELHKDEESGLEYSFINYVRRENVDE